MDPNQFNFEQMSWSDVDDATDIEFMVAAYEYHQQLEQAESSQAPVQRTNIYREREVAEERLRSDYFYQGCKYTDHNF